MYVQSSRLCFSRLSSQVQPNRLVGHVSAKPYRFPLLLNTVNTTRRSLDVTSKIRPWCASAFGYRYLSTSPSWRNSATENVQPNFPSPGTNVETFYISEPPNASTLSIEEEVTSTISTDVPSPANNVETFYISEPPNTSTFSIEEEVTSTISTDVPLPANNVEVFYIPETPKIPTVSIEEVITPSTTMEVPSPATNVETFYIPEPPKVPTFSVEEVIASTASTSTGEPTLVELGLAGFSPSGWVQTALEWLHVDVGMPWWQCIAVATVVLRVCMFPLVIKSQKNAAKMANNFPQLQHLQERMTQARNSGNAMETMRYTHEIQAFMKEKDINPFKSMLVPLAQLPIFMSMFFGLRAMANLPVESLKYGGLFWFTDLTVPDPFYLLPAITSATMFLTIKLGTEMGNVPGQGSTLMLKVLKFMPVPMFFVILNFPSALLCYWTVTNLVSLIQAGILRVPKIRDYFGIDRLVRNPNLDDPSKKKKFWESAKEAWENQKITAELRAREQYAMQLHKHKTGPIPKTYKYDPTKQNKPELETAQNIIQRGAKAAMSSKKPVK